MLSWDRSHLPVIEPRIFSAQWRIWQWWALQTEFNFHKLKSTNLFSQVPQTQIHKVCTNIIECKRKCKLKPYYWIKFEAPRIGLVKGIRFWPKMKHKSFLKCKNNQIIDYCKNNLQFGSIDRGITVHRSLMTHVKIHNILIDI